MLKGHQIKIIDYRNACYQGEVQQDLFHGIGACLTEDFLFNTAIWNKGDLHGPSFTIFPSQKILYGYFQNKEPEGLFCYQLSKQCQFYFMFVSGKMQKIIAAVFPYIQCVLEVGLSENDTINYQKQHNYVDPQQKWEKLEQVLKFKAPEFMKGYRKLIKHSFLNQFKEVQQIMGDQYYFGMTGEGIGVKMDYKQIIVKEIGYFDQNKVLTHIGNRLINQEKQVREEGIYSKPDTLVRYQQKRPLNTKKHYRDYFRLALNFQNKFLQFTNLQNIEKQILKFKDTLKQNTTRRIAQQLIEHLDQQQYQQNEQEEPKSQPKVNNRYNNRHDSTAIMKQNVSLQELKKQLDRSMSHNKTKGKSPYKQYKGTPAQLKYINRTNDKIEQRGNKGEETTGDGNNKQTYGGVERPKYKDVIRKLNYDENERNDYRRYDEKQGKQQRYPIQQNLRPLNRYNTSKSPFRQHKPFRFQYTDENDRINPDTYKNERVSPDAYAYKNDRGNPQTYAYKNDRLSPKAYKNDRINPETYTYKNDRVSPDAYTYKNDRINPQTYTYKKPQQNYPMNSLNRIKKQPQSEDRKLSPYTNINRAQQRRTTPTRTHSDKLAQMYDELQKNNTKVGTDGKYNLNKGKGYQFNNPDIYEQAGLRTGRKVEPVARSPYKGGTRVTNAGMHMGDRNKYNYDFGEGYGERDERLGKHRGNNFGYFDKNR